MVVASETGTQQVLTPLKTAQAGQESVIRTTQSSNSNPDDTKITINKTAIKEGLLRLIQKM